MQKHKFASICGFDEIFDPQGMGIVNWRLFSKIVFPPILVAILNFCVKCKTAFILGTVRDRAISMKFLTHRVFAEFTGDFSQKLFSHRFWQPS